MLERGFLKHQESKEDIHALKRRRMFLFGGIGCVLFSFIALMTTNFQQFEIWIFVMMIGFGLVFTSLWSNFFAQYKNRHRNH